ATPDRYCERGGVDGPRDRQWLFWLVAREDGVVPPRGGREGGANLLLVKDMTATLDGEGKLVKHLGPNFGKGERGLEYLLRHLGDNKDGVVPEKSVFFLGGWSLGIYPRICSRRRNSRKAQPAHQGTARRPGKDGCFRTKDSAITLVGGVTEEGKYLTWNTRETDDLKFGLFALGESVDWPNARVKWSSYAGAGSSTAVAIASSVAAYYRSLPEFEDLKKNECDKKPGDPDEKSRNVVEREASPEPGTAIFGIGTLLLDSSVHAVLIAEMCDKNFELPEDDDNA
ncbi:hypothetical protein MKZ38_002452, partial [Zalerion maritima]